MRKRLVFVINNLNFFVSHRLSLANAALAQDYDVHIIAPPSEQAQVLQQRGITVHELMLSRKGINPLQEFVALYRLYRLFKKLKPDLVHNITIKPIIYGGLAARIARVPSVVNAITGLGYVFVSPSRKAHLLRYFTGLGYSLAFRHPNMRAIFQNRDDQNKFVDAGLLPSDRAILVRGSGVSMLKFQAMPEPPLPCTVLLASRLLWDKGIGEYVEAARILKQRSDVRLVLGGDVDLGNPSSISKEQIGLWVKEGVIEWWGWFDDIKDAFAKSHIVCLPSYREGTPRVLIEAGACARPVITTDVPGCRDVIYNEENGLLVPKHNAKAIAEAVLRLAENSELRLQMGQRGREIVERSFSENIVNTKTLAVYDALLAIS